MTNRFAHITQQLKTHRTEQDVLPAAMLPGDETRAIAS